MGYDTLILSGGSIKGISLLGSFKYLLDNGKIKRKELKHIIVASAGALMAIPFLFNIKIEMFYKIIKETKINIVDKEDYKLENLFNEFGFYDNMIVDKYVGVLCKYILKRDNITLKELYKLNKIKYTVKVSNITDNSVEYFNYKNQPDLDLKTLVKMTTSIPIVFKPISYKGCLYSDGANGGGLPIEYNKSKNYIAIILCPLERDSLPKNPNILQYLDNLINVQYQINDFNIYKKYKNLIVLDLNIPLKLETNDEEKEKLLIEGFKQTKQFFKDLEQHS